MIQTEQHKRKSRILKIREKQILEGLELVKKVHSIYKLKYALYKKMSKEDLDDMLQDCIVEMIRAVDRFDENRGVKLLTYLNPRIRGSLTDTLRKLSKESAMRQPAFMDVSIDFICGEIDNIMSLNKDQAYIKLDKLNLSEDYIQDIFIDISSDSQSYEIFDSLTDLPDVRIYIILSYYVMNKSIKEISKELGFNPDTGWIYRLKREGIDKLKELLIDKKILKEDSL